MTNTHTNTRVETFKAQARRLRQDLADTGRDISHSQALETVAKQHGARDWNTLRAMASRPGNNRPLAVGDRVAGEYLGQPFTGYVHGLVHPDQSDHSRVTLQFDEPVDVVTFDSFSSFRQRVSGIVNREGRSLTRTSDGRPHLVVHHEGL